MGSLVKRPYYPKFGWHYIPDHFGKKIGTYAKLAKVIIIPFRFL